MQNGHCEDCKTPSLCSRTGCTLAARALDRMFGGPAPEAGGDVLTLTEEMLVPEDKPATPPPPPKPATPEPVPPRPEAAPAPRPPGSTPTAAPATPPRPGPPPPMHFGGLSQQAPSRPPAAPPVAPPVRAPVAPPAAPLAAAPPPAVRAPAPEPAPRPPLAIEDPAAVPSGGPIEVRPLPGGWAVMRGSVPVGVAFSPEQLGAVVARCVEAA